MTELETLLDQIDPNVSRILDRVLGGREIARDEALQLFDATGDELKAVTAVADILRRRKNGDVITFVNVRNINFTNICYTGCRFCSFARHRGEPGSELLTLEEITRRAEEARERGATEVCLQGGLNPFMPAGYYKDMLTAIKKCVPDMHIHAFSPFEIKYGAERMGVAVEYFLQMLKAHGLGSIPGTAAEIFDTSIRLKLTRNKLMSGEWEQIIKTAHWLGIPSTATIMYGHIDAPPHWVDHLMTIRNIQKDTGKFTEFVPLGFVHYNTPLYLSGESRPGPTREEHIKMHAMARIILYGVIDNIQVSWVKLGLELAKYILKECGANDFGGTLMNESISRSAGATAGEEVTPDEMCALINDIDRVPVQRDTLYKILEIFDDHLPPRLSPLRPGINTFNVI